MIYNPPPNACYCSGRCCELGYCPNSSKQAVASGLAEWLRGLSASQAVNKPRVRVKAGREVVA